MSRLSKRNYFVTGSIPALTTRNRCDVRFVGAAEETWPAFLTMYAFDRTPPRRYQKADRQKALTLRYDLFLRVLVKTRRVSTTGRTYLRNRALPGKVAIPFTALPRSCAEYWLCFDISVSADKGKFGHLRSAVEAFLRQLDQDYLQETVNNRAP